MSLWALIILLTACAWGAGEPASQIQPPASDSISLQQKVPTYNGLAYNRPEIYHWKVFEYKEFSKEEDSSKHYEGYALDSDDQPPTVKHLGFDQRLDQLFRNTYLVTEEGLVFKSAYRYHPNYDGTSDTLQQIIEPRHPIIFPWNVSQNFQSQYTLTFFKFFGPEKGEVTFYNQHDLKFIGQQTLEIVDQKFDVLIFEDHEKITALSENETTPFLETSFRVRYYYGKDRGLILKETFPDQPGLPIKKMIFKRHLSVDTFEKAVEKKEEMEQSQPLSPHSKI